MWATMAIRMRDGSFKAEAGELASVMLNKAQEVQKAGLYNGDPVAEIRVIKEGAFAAVRKVKIAADVAPQVAPGRRKK